MLTLFTTLKPHSPHVATIQRNALQSWMHLHPACEILVFGEQDDETIRLTNELGLRHITSVSHNGDGLPHINDLFHQAQQLAANDLLCYVNADIIFMSDFMQAIKRVALMENPFLMVGRRWDIDLDMAIDFSAGWETRLKEQVSSSGRLHSARAIDYFAFPRHFWGALPAFIVGRPGWDNWMLAAALKRGASLIDASDVVMAVHQNDSAQSTIHHKINRHTDVDAQQNIILAKDDFFWSLQFSIQDATHKLTPQRLVPVHPSTKRRVARLGRRLRLCLRTLAVARLKRR